MWYEFLEIENTARILQLQKTQILQNKLYGYKIENTFLVAEIHLNINIIWVQFFVISKLIAM